MFKEDEWAELVRKAQNGDQAAYREFLSGVYPFVRNTVNRKLGSLVHGDDVTQECLIGVHRSLPTFHPTRRLKPWLMAIIRHKTTDYLRKQGRIQSREIIDDEVVVTAADRSANTNYREQNGSDDRGLSIGGAGSVKEGCEGEILGSIFEHLPESLKRAVFLTKVEGVSYKEASLKEGVSEVALRKRISRAYRLIRERVGRELE